MWTSECLCSDNGNDSDDDINNNDGFLFDPNGASCEEELLSVPFPEKALPVLVVALVVVVASVGDEEGINCPSSSAANNVCERLLLVAVEPILRKFLLVSGFRKLGFRLIPFVSLIQGRSVTSCGVSVRG